MKKLLLILLCVPLLFSCGEKKVKTKEQVAQEVIWEHFYRRGETNSNFDDWVKNVSKSNQIQRNVYILLGMSFIDKFDWKINDDVLELRNK